MNWMLSNLCLICALAVLKPNFVATDDGSGQTNFHDEDEMLLSDMPIDSHDVLPVQKTAESARRLIRQPYTPSMYNRNFGDNVDLEFVNGPKSDFRKPTEETFKRLTRNPDALEDIVGQFQELGSGMTKNLLQQIHQSAPDMSKSFGEALNEALTQTNILAQSAPGNLDLSQLTQQLRPGNLSRSLDFGQLGQTLSKNFLVGATQNLLAPNSKQTLSARDSDTASAKGGWANTDGVGVGASSDGSLQQEAGLDGSGASQAPNNPLEQLVGKPLFLGLPTFPTLRPLGQIPPLSPFGLLGQMASLMPLGSEISEVRVLPQEDSPYKLSPKPVDRQKMAEMKLKAILKDALTSRTIPILWFHLPNKTDEQKSNEEQQIQEKLKNFEKEVIDELMQLQELAKMANELKIAHLKSGFPPTDSLSAKLNLHDIPLYDITLADIERTLRDEQVIMLMQTLVQKRKDFQRHQQAATEYVNDLTGTPSKRHITNHEDTLKSMEKEDMLKMMEYAYHMAALNGHEMPWINKKMSSLDRTDINNPMASQQQRQFMDGNSDERQWLAEKEERMRMEANPAMMASQMQQPQSSPRQILLMHQRGNNRRKVWPVDTPMCNTNMQMQHHNQGQMMPMQNPNVDTFMQMQHHNQGQMMPMQNPNVDAFMQMQRCEDNRGQMMPMQMPDMNMPTQQQQQRMNSEQTSQMPDMNMSMQKQRESNERGVPIRITVTGLNMPMQQPSKNDGNEENNEKENKNQMSDMNLPMQQQRDNYQRSQMSEMNMSGQKQRESKERILPIEIIVPGLNIPMRHPSRDDENEEDNEIEDPNQVFLFNMPIHQQNVNNERKMMRMQNPMPNMSTSMQQQQENNQRRQMSDMTMPSQQQRGNNERQMEPTQNQMSDFKTPMQQRENNQRQFMPQNMATSYDLLQRNMQQIHRSMDGTSPQPEEKQEKLSGTNTEMTSEKLIETPIPQNPQIDTEAGKTTVTNIPTTTAKESKPEITENDSKARIAGLDGLFGGLMPFGQGKQQQPPVVNNYYYNYGANGHYPSKYPGSAPGFGHGTDHTHRPLYPPQSAPNHHYRSAPNNHANVYRTAVGDEEIAELLQQSQHLAKPVTFFRK